MSEITRPPLAHRQLTVAGTALGFSSAKDGTGSTVGLPNGVGFLRVQVLTAAIRYCHNDTPTASFGHRADAGDWFTVDTEFATVLMIRETATSATLEIECYG